jgi:GntR family transcriptional regulator, transcriptional repressor for pyruvate dehydrogenase complex
MATSQAAEALSLSPITRSSLTESVARHLLTEIRDKRLEPGTKIPSERDLMAGLGVGRSTIREAINGLAMLGVIEVRHGQGAFVTEMAAGLERTRSIAAALARGVTYELFEARRLVEVEAARLAAERRTDADLAEISRALDDHAKAIADGVPAVEPSVRFHVEVAEAAHNEVLASFVASFSEILGQRGPVLEEVDGFREWEIEQHRSVYEPIEAGDPALAVERMRGHLDAVAPYHERIGMS